MARGRRRGRAASEQDPEPPSPEAQGVEEVESEGEEEVQAEEQQQEQEQQPDSDEERAPAGDVVNLQFDEELTWRPGKSIPVSTLIPRLKRLSRELHGMEQDHVNLDSLVAVSEALGQRNLLAHKDEGVRAYTASCMVDILQLSAPDAPFTPDQLKMFFTLVVSHIFPALGDTSHPYHKEHKYVLRSLGEVQSIVLINDVDGADDLLLRLFSTFFDTVSSGGAEDDVSQDVSRLMTDTMIALIEEANGVSPKVIEVIMAQFLRAAPPGGFHSRSSRDDESSGQSTLLLKSEPPAYIMAKDICNQCTEKMAHYVSQYFSDVIIDASRFAAKSNGHHGEDDDEDAPRGPTDAELKELRKAHLLIKELWRAAPSVLQNVIPQVEAELSADNVELRQIATETLGDMISGIGAAGPPPTPPLDPAAYPPVKLSDEPSTADTATSILRTPLSPQSFAQTHASAYHSFIGRNKDRMPAVRATWTTSVGYILATSAGSIGLGREEQAELVRSLGDKLNDSDERVRLAAVRAVELFGFRDFVLKLGQTGSVSKEGSILSALADRCRDKRAAVRVDAMTLLGNLWGVGVGEMAANQELVSCLNGIPSVIFKAWYANDLELNVLIDRVIFESLLPLSYPPIKSKSAKGGSQSQSGAGAVSDQDRIRAERILLLVQQLDAQARKAFFTMQARQPQFAGVLGAYIKQCESYNGGVMDENSSKKTAALEKTVQYIGQFFPDPYKAKQDLQKFAKANDRRNYQLLKFAVASESDFKTVRGALKELAKRLQGTPTASALETLVPFLYRSALLIFNKSHLSTILDYSKTDHGGFGSIAHEILHETSVKNPDMFKNFVVDLCKDIVQQAPNEKKQNEPTVVDILRATSAFAKKYPDDIPHSKDFAKALTGYAMYGQPVKASKYAIKILLAQEKKQGEVAAQKLFTRIMDKFSLDSPFFLNKLQCVSQLYLQVPKVPMEADEEILNVTVQKIVREVRQDASNKDPDWVEDENMDEELHAKLLSLRIAANRIRSIADVDEAKAQATPVFKLLMTLVNKDGEICKTKDTPKHHKSKLRLLAAKLLLKLCTVPHFDDVLSHKDFNNLAFMTQDREPNVRRGFVEKLMRYLGQGRLRARFYTMLFLMAFEPIPEVKTHVETWIRSRVRQLQGIEKNPMLAAMGRLIPLLAHHPDYSTGIDDLADHARYIFFYVSHVATETNLGYIYKVAERVKQTRDNIDPEMSENLYVLCDLAAAVIRQWQDKKAWIFQAYPDRIGLPQGLFAPLPTHDEAQRIARKQYIPDGIEDRIEEMMRFADKKKKRKLTDERGEGAPAAKKPKSREPKLEPTKSVKKKAATKAKPKPKKASRPARSSSPLVDEADRRRSGRSRKTASAYRERDSSEDEEEMMEGVATWKYEGQRGEDDDQAATSLEQSEVEEEHEAMDENEDEEEPAPKKSMRRNGTSAAASRAKAKGRSSKNDDASSELSDPASVLDEPVEGDDEEEEELASSPAATATRSNGRRNRGSEASADLPSRPAVKPKPPPTKKQLAAAAKAEKEKEKKAKAEAEAAAEATSSRAGTRSRRGRAAARKDSDDMDVDTD